MSGDAALDSYPAGLSSNPAPLVACEDGCETEYSQGVMGDGAAILRNGLRMTVDEIVEKLDDHARIVAEKDAEIAYRDNIIHGYSVDTRNYQGLIRDAEARAEALAGVLRFMRSRFDNRMDDTDRRAIEMVLSEAGK